jgi:hypothetical protein
MLEARAVALKVFRVSEHTEITHVLFILLPEFWPLGHFKKAASKIFALNALNDFFAAVTCNFDCFYSIHLWTDFLYGQAGRTEGPVDRGDDRGALARIQE